MTDEEFKRRIAALAALGQYTITNPVKQYANLDFGELVRVYGIHPTQRIRQDEYTRGYFVPEAREKNDHRPRGAVDDVERGFLMAEWEPRTAHPDDLKYRKYAAACTMLWINGDTWTGGTCTACISPEYPQLVAGWPRTYSLTWL